MRWATLGVVMIAAVGCETSWRDASPPASQTDVRIFHNIQYRQFCAPREQYLIKDQYLWDFLARHSTHSLPQVDFKTQMAIFVELARTAGGWPYAIRVESVRKTETELEIVVAVTRPEGAEPLWCPGQFFSNLVVFERHDLPVVVKTKLNGKPAGEFSYETAKRLGEQIDALAKKLGKGRLTERLAVARELSLIYDPRAVDVLQRLLIKDYHKAGQTAYTDEWILHKEGLRLLMAAGHPSVAPILKAAIDKDEYTSAAAALPALAYNCGKAEAPRFISLAKNQDADVRNAAITALGITGGEEVVPILMGCLADPDPGVRTAAIASLKRITGHNVESTSQEEAVRKWREWHKTRERK